MNKTIHTFLALFIPVSFLFSLPIACSDSHDYETISLEASQAGAHEVVQETYTFVDFTRPTAAYRDYPGAASRTLVSDVWYPAGPEEESAPPYPLIVFSHGLSAFRNQSDYLTEHLASHGYVVVSADYPLTGLSAPSGLHVYDVLNQPGDISFLIDTLTSLSQDPASTLFGLVDGENVGAIGHSYGGLTTVLVSHAPDLRDTRIKASLPLSPFDCLLDEDFFAESEVPILFMGGNIDLITMFESNLRKPFNFANSPKYLVEINGGIHMGFISSDVTMGMEKMGFEALSAMIREGIVSARSMVDIGIALGGDLNGCMDIIYLIEGDPPEYDIEPIDSARQREISLIYSTAFFGIYLKNQDTWRPILSEGFDGLHDDIEFSKEE